MTTPQHEHLSRRERQIMDVIYQKGKATAAEVMDQIPDAPSYSAVRALMRILVEKGHLSYALSGNRYIFKQKTAYELRLSLVGSEMCIRDSRQAQRATTRVVDILRGIRFAGDGGVVGSDGRVAGG